MQARRNGLVEYNCDFRHSVAYRAGEEISELCPECPGASTSRGLALVNEEKHISIYWDGRGRVLVLRGDMHIYSADQDFEGALSKVQELLEAQYESFGRHIGK